jgi:arylsulfatase A-like enzyme
LTDGGTLTRVAEKMAARAPAEKPLFLWVNYMDQHMPYRAPARWMPPKPEFALGPEHLSPELFPERRFDASEKAYVRALYDGTSRYVDDCIGRLISAVERYRGGRPRLTYFLSDHGEEFWDHGDRGDDPAYYRRGVGHGHSQYNHQLHVPLVFHYPGVVQEGRRLPGVVSLTDVYPTVLELAGVDGPQADGGGQSLREHLTGVSVPEDDERVVFAEAIHWGPERQVAATAEHKLIHCPVTGECELYAWSEGDPEEREDLAGQEAFGEIRGRLMKRLEEWNERLAGAGAARQLTPEEEELAAERLRALGYL